MIKREIDGSAGDANYGEIGNTYAAYRKPEPRIAEFISAALGSAKTVLNVGAGAGSYEPVDRNVFAVEPSASMRAQRPSHLSVAIDAVAERLPFPDAHFDASMATFTVHQWRDLAAGLSEMRRVTRGPVVILSCDPDLVQKFWLNDYAPDVLKAEARRYPAIQRIDELLNRHTKAVPVLIPLSCKDGFNEAYYGRPEKFLEDKARLACSAWSFVSRETADSYIENLRRDLDRGIWDSQYGHLRSQSEFEGSLRLVISEP